MPNPGPVDYDLNLLTAAERRSVRAAQEQPFVPEEEGDIRDLVIREAARVHLGLRAESGAAKAMLRRLRQRLARSIAPPLSTPTAPTAPEWVRAERLRLLLEMDGEEPALAFEDFLQTGLFNPNPFERFLLREIDQETWELFQAVRQAATELRDGQYAALERLSALLYTSSGAEVGADVDGRITSASVHDPLAVAECLIELGWIDDG